MINIYKVLIKIFINKKRLAPPFFLLAVLPLRIHANPCGISMLIVQLFVKILSGIRIRRASECFFNTAFFVHYLLATVDAE